LEAGGFFRLLIVEIDLVQVRAHAQQHAARRDRRKVAFLQTVMRVQEVFNAVRLGQQLAAIERVDVISVVEVW
jgi:hypothetical protein